jgi:hypothetical protein
VLTSVCIKDLESLTGVFCVDMSDRSYAYQFMQYDGMYVAKSLGH